MIGAIVAIVPFVRGSACLSGPALARRRLGKYLSIYLFYLREGAGQRNPFWQ